jgi:plasmid stabilization system protein ParE
MTKQIIWSPLSEKDFARILEYLDKEWDEKVVNQFIEITNNFLEQISINPKQFPLIHKKMKVRKCVITKQNTLFYRDSKQQIDILRIYDTRQDPKKLKFK